MKKKTVLIKKICLPEGAVRQLTALIGHEMRPLREGQLIQAEHLAPGHLLTDPAAHIPRPARLREFSAPFPAPLCSLLPAPLALQLLQNLDQIRVLAHLRLDRRLLNVALGAGEQRAVQHHVAMLQQHFDKVKTVVAQQ